jgi:hypothetical protein
MYQGIARRSKRNQSKLIILFQTVDVFVFSTVNTRLSKPRNGWISGIIWSLIDELTMDMDRSFAQHRTPSLAEASFRGAVSGAPHQMPQYPDS